MKITDVAVKQGVSVYVLLFVLVVGGIVSYVGLPLESAPEIDIPVVLVTTPYVGVSPEDIESLVTRPLEKEIGEIKEIKDLRSTSAEGASIITVEFDVDMNLDEALQEIREKVDLGKAKLPKDAEEPIIQEISTSDFPMMIVNVTGSYGLVKLRDVAEDLQDRIEDVRGILEVRLNGGLEREIQVRVDPVRLNHYHLSLQHVVDAVKSENLNMPGGDVKLGDASYLVRVPGEFTTVAEIADVIVKLRGDNPVFVRDVAQVVDSFKERSSASRLDGRENVSLTITKRPGENIVRIADDIKSEVAAAQATMPPGTEVVILSDESEDIRNMVHELENTMLSGMILVIAVIMLAMGLRNSILVGLAVPLSMLLSFVTLSLLGITLNMVVLFALILALGMLVDNAIVIVENIYRHAEQGMSPTEAALAGTREVAWAVTTSTLTTVAGFFPVVFWPGVMGEFMAFLPKTVIITLLASLFVALIITPVLCAGFLRAGAKRGNETGRFSQLATAFVTRYDALLDVALKRRWRVAAIGVVVFVATLVVFGAAGLGVELFPAVTPRKMIVTVDAGDGTRFAASDRIVRRIERDLGKNENIEHYVANVGSGSGMAFLTADTTIAHKSQLSVDFLDAEERVESPQVTIESLRGRLAELPGARVEITKEQMGPPTGAPVQLEIYGDDFHELGRIAQRVRERIRGVDGLVDLKDDYTVGRPEVQINVDRERAKLLGAGTASIASTVRTAINGTKASVFRDGEDEYDITVRLEEDYRSRLPDIEALRINVASRTDPNTFHLVPIGEVAKLETRGGTGSIRHKDRKRVVTITGNAEGRLATDVLADVQAELATFELPKGYEISYAGEDVDRKEAADFIARALLIALLLIGLILVTQFNSVFKPVVIMIAVQMSLVGVLWGQVLLRLPFGIIMTGLGVISLAGVVVNNAIVLVDYIQQLRARGVPRNEALKRAGLVRLRPVLLTAITTILGLMPMAFGISIDFYTMSVQVGGQSADFWQPMATAVIAGLLVATLLTLVLVPVLYSFFDDLEVWLGQLLGRRAPHAAAAAGGVADPRLGEPRT